MKPDGETRDVIVAGASAGGVDALSQFVSALPAGLDAAVFVVLHLWPHAESLLPHILNRAGGLPACPAGDGDLIQTGCVYAAPPDRHLLLYDSAMRVVRGPKENNHRPAIDVLFRSAAMVYGPRVIGVLLTGADDDGAAGLKAIQEAGGIAVVQDPADAKHPEMPQSALEVLKPDFTLPLSEIGPLVRDIVTGVVKPNGRKAVSEPVEKVTGQEQGLQVDVKQFGTPTAFSCPDCNGTLWELEDGELLRYRCRVGHAYSAQSIVEAESNAVERSLWEAVRTLEESASMSRRIAQKSEILRPHLQNKAEERERHAQVIRGLLLNNSGKAA